MLPALRGRFDVMAATAIAFCAALLWMLHPLQTQAVTYIVQRMESLMGLFYLLTLYCFIRSIVSRLPLIWQVAAGAFLEGWLPANILVTWMYDLCFWPVGVAAIAGGLVLLGLRIRRAVGSYLGGRSSR